VRMVAGVKAPELRETLQDYPLPVLPSVKEARKQVQDRAPSDGNKSTALLPPPS